MSKAGDIAHEHIYSKPALISWGKKLAEYATIFAVYWFFGRPAADNFVDGRIDIHQQAVEAADATKISFRTLLSKEIDVPSDRIHIEFGKMYNGLAVIEEWIPMLEAESESIRPRLEIIDEEEWWIANDNKAYRVTRNGGAGFFWRNGQWNPIFK